jgi:hypothetical protein
MYYLPLQVGDIDNVGIGNAQHSNARRGKVKGCGRT